MFPRLVLLSALASFVASTSSSAHEICHSVPFEQHHPDWTQTATVPQFDPSVGTLTGITITFRGKARELFGVESLDPVSRQATTTFGAAIRLYDATSAPMFALAPTRTYVDAVSAFDTRIDWRGTSGVFHDNILALQEESVSPALDAQVLARYVGTGAVSFTATAQRINTITGLQQRASQFGTKASASLEVCYTYQPNGGGFATGGPDVASAAQPTVRAECATHERESLAPVVAVCGMYLPL